MDINTCVLPEDEASLTHTKYHIHKLIDSASTKFRSYIRAHFTVIMPTIVSDTEIFYPRHIIESQHNNRVGRNFRLNQLNCSDTYTF